MTHIINGTTFYPTSGRWMSRETLGITGDGHPVYPATRLYEMRFNFMTPAEFKTLQDAYELTSTTGTIVVAVPDYAVSPYAQREFSGCTLREPETSEFYEEHYSDVYLIVNVNTI